MKITKRLFAWICYVKKIISMFIGNLNHAVKRGPIHAASRRGAIGTVKGGLGAVKGAP